MSESLEESLVECCNIRESDERCHSGGVTILDLPYDVLDHIFSFLSIQERIRTEWVCRSWAEFGKSYKWSWPKKLEGNMFLNYNDDIWSSVLSRCGSNIKVIEIIIMNIPLFAPTSRTCQVIGAKCPNVTNITFEFIEDIKNSEVLLSISKGCTKLKKVGLNVPYGLESGLTATMCLFLTECMSLEYLELVSESNHCYEKYLDAIMVPLKGLKLSVNSLTNRDPVIQKLLYNRSDPIEQLEVKLRMWSKERLDFPVEVVHHYKNTLRLLDLPDLKMSSTTWCKMLEPMKHLEVLTLGTSGLIDDKFMNVLVDSCKKLGTLDLSNTAVTDLGVSYLTALENLTVLNLNQNEGIKGEGILSLASCGRLEKFYFNNIWHRGSSIEESCMALATNCPKLRLLDVRFNVNITHKLVDEFRSAVERGLLKGPVSVYSGMGHVDQSVEICKNLKLFLC